MAPLDDTVFLQLGGSGSHAIKALLGGARCAGLLSPSLQEVLLGQALADYLGVGDRFFGIVGIGELVPLADGTLDRVYAVAGAPQKLSTAFPNWAASSSRVDVRASSIRERIQSIPTGATCLDAFVFVAMKRDPDHPLNTDELESLAAPLFKNCEIYASGGLARYAVVLLSRTAGIGPSVANAARLYRAERRYSTASDSIFVREYGCDGMLRRVLPLLVAHHTRPLSHG